MGQHKGPRGKIQAGIEPGDSGAVWEDGSDRHNLLLTSSLPAHAKPDRSSSLCGVAPGTSTQGDLDQHLLYVLELKHHLYSSSQPFLLLPARGAAVPALTALPAGLGCLQLPIPSFSSCSLSSIPLAPCLHLAQPPSLSEPPGESENGHFSCFQLLLMSTTFLVIIIIIIVLKTVFTTSSRSELHTKQTLSTTETRTGLISRRYLLRSHQRGTQTFDSFNH